jgi:glycosyltransferase involved in cell wall biosynthesis
MRDPTTRDMMAAFQASSPPADDAGVVSRLITGLDLSRTHFRAREFIGLPDASFVARAAAACFGVAPSPAQFFALRDRLSAGTVSQAGLLRALAASGRASVSGVRQQLLRDAWARSFPADMALRVARLGRDILRLPRNLRRKLGQGKSAAAAAPPVQQAAARKPRIALLGVSSQEEGGAERFYAGLEEALIQAGMGVERIVVESREGSFSDITQSYRRFFDLDLSGYDGVISSKAPSYAARHPNHVCYLMHTMRAWYDMFEASHPFASMRTHDQRRQIQALDTAALQCIRRLAIGEEVAARLRAYNGLDAKVVRPPSTLVGLHEGAFTHLFLPGRLHPWKRVNLAIAAMRFVKSPVRLVIAGTGQEEARLRAQAKSDPRIVFTGRVTEAALADLYADAAAVLFLPRQEDLGFITLEAFAAGKPVITCTDSGEPARIVQDGTSGFVCPPAPRAIAGRIECLVNDPARAAAMGQAGKTSVAAIGWDTVAAELIAALGFS